MSDADPETDATASDESSVTSLDESTLPPAERTAKAWWDSWARYFQEEYGDGEIPVEVAFGPGAPPGDDLGLLGDVAGKRVIELGCGGAQFGLALAERGATVTGVDISAEQLAYARELAADREQAIDLLQASVTDLGALPTASYDLAVSAFAFQWVADLQRCLAEAYRVLRPGGRLVYSVDHPVYKLMDPETQTPTRSYFGDRPRVETSERFDAEMVIYRRRIGETVALLTDVGFEIEAIREPGFADPDDYEATYGSFVPELMAKVPPTVVYAARKPDAVADD